MTLHNYWWLLLWPLLYGGFSFFVNMRREELVDGQWCIRWTPLAAYSITVPFVLWAGGRQYFGDTEQYRETFMSLPSSLNQIGPYMSGVRKGPAFRLL